MRAFIAIDVPEAIRIAIADVGEELRKQTSDIVPVKANAIHITLQFLGEINESEAPVIEEAMDAAKLPNFTLSVEGVDKFGRRTIYAGISEGSVALKMLYSLISSGLDAANVQFSSHGYTPHITIGRVKGRIDRKRLSSLIKPDRHKEFGSFMADSFALKKSILTKDGPIYEELYKVELL